MTFYLMVNKRGTITLLDTQEITVVKNNEPRLISEINTKAIVLRKNVNQTSAKANKCEGLYCNYKEVFENAMIDEKDELNNLYIMESDIEKVFRIEYKSIILDLVERLKTIERVEVATGQSKQYI